MIFTTTKQQPALEKAPFADTLDLEPSPAADQLFDGAEIMTDGLLTSFTEHQNDAPEAEDALEGRGEIDRAASADEGRSMKLKHLLPGGEEMLTFSLIDATMLFGGSPPLRERKTQVRSFVGGTKRPHGDLSRKRMGCVTSL